ncbi:MAG: hypothetical protein V1775_15585 [Bacteroidota bacterium]
MTQISRITTDLFAEVAEVASSRSIAVHGCGSTHLPCLLVAFRLDKSEDARQRWSYNILCFLQVCNWE